MHCKVTNSGPCGTTLQKQRAAAEQSSQKDLAPCSEPLAAAACLEGKTVLAPAAMRMRVPAGICSTRGHVGIRKLWAQYFFGGGAFHAGDWSPLHLFVLINLVSSGSIFCESWAPGSASV
jgi:hypothetical protein